ncbi:geranylgeranyl reductase family protein [Micrococcales bacterium 31B]|nr:geranylgeranyl reductase family protein [Micrococcales bacterium 31B]
MNGPFVSAHDADVLIVGAGPAGATLSAYLSDLGVSCLSIDKSRFPREKVCGDGLTPRATREIQQLGLAHDSRDGWIRNHGLRLVVGRRSLELPWPELSEYPSYGLVRSRAQFDAALVTHARARGAEIREGVSCVGIVRHPLTGRALGARVRSVDASGRKVGSEETVSARLVIAADGVGSMTAKSFGIHPNPKRPIGVAVRTYFESPRSDDPWLESWLELWDGKPGASQLLPGYGWIFGGGDGTCNVGLGILNSSKQFGSLDYRALLRAWCRAMPAEWQFDEHHQRGKVLGAALPMGFSRKPHYRNSLALLGDAGGLVNPFNGEGIAYAMQSARVAAPIIAEALKAPNVIGLDRAMQAYPQALSQDLGGYYNLGRVFVKLIGNPRVMSLATRAGISVPALMKVIVKLLANLTDSEHGAVEDRVINALSRWTPSA